MGEKDNINHDEIDRLQTEIARLKGYEQIVKAQSKGLGASGSLFAFIWAGPKLSLAFRNFLSAWLSKDGSFPVGETADLLAAIVQRIIRVGLLVTFIALIPTGLLLWQNFIMKDQYGALIGQIEAQMSADMNQQITQHMPLLLSKDRANFWAAVSFFSSTPELSMEARNRLVRLLVEGEGTGACASLEALATLAPFDGSIRDGMLIRNVTSEVRRVTGKEKFPLGGQEIRDLACDRLRLRQVGISQLSFESAQLPNSNFTYVDLAGTTFRDADLKGTHLYAVQFSSSEAGRRSDMSDADLRSVFFEHSNDFPVLNGAKLGGAMITWVTGEVLKREPKRYFSDAICLSPREAEACFNFHRAKLFEEEIAEDVSQFCSAELNGPIIRVLGHESERLECEQWLRGPN